MPSGIRDNLAILVLGGAALGLTVGSTQQEAPAKPHPDLPEEFIQVLPRGRIAAIDTPSFVAAGEAEIADEAWVLGVLLDGQAHAYSLNLLNRHEVVNDQVNGKNFAAVW